MAMMVIQAPFAEFGGEMMAKAVAVATAPMPLTHSRTCTPARPLPILLGSTLRPMHHHSGLRDA